MYQSSAIFTKSKKLEENFSMIYMFLVTLYMYVHAYNSSVIVRFLYGYLTAKSSFFKSNDMRTRRKRNFVTDNNSLWPRGVVPYLLDGNMCRFVLELIFL